MNIDFPASADLEDRRFCRYFAANTFATDKNHSSRTPLKRVDRLSYSEQPAKNTSRSNSRSKKINSNMHSGDKHMEENASSLRMDALHQRLSDVPSSIMNETRWRSNLHKEAGHTNHATLLARNSDKSSSDMTKKTKLNGIFTKSNFSILQCLVLAFLLTSGTYASAIPKASTAREELSRQSNARNKAKISRIHVRAIRSALTPPTQSEKTTSSKRDLSPFISHRDPQKLVTKMGHYVEIKKNGKVKGTRRDSPYSVFELISIHPGIIAIRSKKTGRYLSMDKKGKLVGLKSYTPASNFHESLVENNYFVFYQEVFDKVGRNRKYRRKVYMAFDKRGKPKRGKKVQQNDSSAHFQKLKAQYAIPDGRHRSKGKNLKGRKKRPRKVKKA